MSTGGPETCVCESRSGLYLLVLTLIIMRPWVLANVIGHGRWQMRVAHVNGKLQ